MRLIGADAVRAALPYDALIEALRGAFARDITVPLRHRHEIDDGHALLLMPAWQGRAPEGTKNAGVRKAGVKIVGVVPRNGQRGLPAVSSTYLLVDGETGEHLAVIDGGALTARRTVAASALAGDFLARREARTLLIVGSGHVAQGLAQAWRAVRPVERVRVWNRSPQGAQALAASLRADGFDALATTDLAAAVAEADIVSCATLAREPLIRGAWLRPGTHLDLIGGYLPSMREADDDVVRQARVFVDTPAALAEAGDITAPLASGALAAIAGTLAQLCRGEVQGRREPEEITLFKSVGSALEDLAAATLVYARATDRPAGNGLP